VEHAVVLAPLHIAVCELLLHRPGHLLGLDHVIRLGQAGSVGSGYVSRHPDKPAQITQHKGKMALSAGSPLGLPHDLSHGIAGKMGDLAVPDDLLGHKADKLVSVLQGIVYAVSHIDLIAIALDAGAESWVHSLYRIQVTGSNHDEIAGYRLGSD